MNLVDERLRAEFFKAPDPAIAAAHAAAVVQERRILNSRLNLVEIGRLSQLTAALDENNALLIASGDVAVEFAVAADPLEMHWRELLAHIGVLERLIRQQTDRLDYHRARAAAAERERMIANETPGERLLRERAEAVEARLRELEERIADSQGAQRYVPPASAAPQMSALPVSMGDGLCAGYAIVPVSASARRR
jgi:hypothetical protein